MTTISILPSPAEKGGIVYRGVTSGKTSQGSTVGEALDALTRQLPQTEDSLLIVVQSLRPDRFFDATQQRRLASLMHDRDSAQERGEKLTPQEQAELADLIDAELQGATARAANLAEGAGQ